MKIGVLKEPDFENRVALIPDTVKSLVDMGHEVSVENNAGERSFLSDVLFQEAGANIFSRNEIFNSCDMVVSINPPDNKDIEGFKKGMILISVLNPFTNMELIHNIANSGVSAFSLDFLPRTTRAQAMDILSSMATVAGYKAVLSAAMALPKFFPMFMSAAGTIKPAKVLILGAGVAGLQAISIARKLGAVVEVFDVRTAVKEEVQSLGGRFVEVEGAIDDKSAGGYAVEQSEEFKQKQAQAIHDHAAKSNVVICTAQIPGKKAPLLVKKETVAKMVPGSVIVDLAASTGGNCELTQNGKTIAEHGVTIIGKSDFPSDMPMDSSQMFSKNVFNFIKLFLDENNSLKIDLEDDIIQGTCICHNQEIVNERIKNLV